MAQPTPPNGPAKTVTSKFTTATTQNPFLKQAMQRRKISPDVFQPTPGKPGQFQVTQTRRAAPEYPYPDMDWGDRTPAYQLARTQMSQQLPPQEMQKWDNNRRYWENPQRVARYYGALQSLPPEQRANLPFDEQGLTQAYMRLAEYNRGLPAEFWKTPEDTDYYAQIGTMQRPPDIFEPDYELSQAPDPTGLYPMPKDQAGLYFDTTGLQTQGDNVLIPASWLSGQQGGTPEQPMPDMINGIPASTYNQLKPWQQFLLNASPAGSGAAMGGGQGAVMGLIAGGPAGAVAGGLLGGGLGGLFGMAADNPEAQKVISLLNILDWPAEQTERALGLVSQIISSTFEPDKYGPVKEIFDNLPAAWEAGHFTENVSFLPVNAQGELEAWEITSPEPTRTKVQDDGALSSLMLAEARKRILQGESLENIESDFRARVGMAYDVREAIGHMVLDPLNIVALGENALIKAGAKWAKNVPLIKAVDTIQELNKTRNVFNQAGALDILGEYSRNLRLMKPAELAKFAPLSNFIAGRFPALAETVGKVEKQATRTIAGVDEAGQLIDYATQPTARAGLAKAFQHMITLTPQSKANVLTYQLAQGMDVMIHDATDARQLEHGIKAVANLKPGDTLQGLEDANMMQWFESAEAQPAPQAVRAALPQVETALEAWNRVQDQPGRPGAITVLQRVADAASTEGKKIAINDIIRMFGEAENKTDFERIYRGLAETIRANVEAGRVDKAVLDEFLQGGYGKYAETARLFYGEDGIPFTFEQLKARVSAALAQGMEEWSVKYFGVKPRGWGERVSNAVKGFQTLTMLNTPTFVANNYINNILTLSWDGLIGINTKGGRATWLKQMGMDAEKMRIGMTAADLGKVGTEIDNAKKRPYSMGEVIRKALNTNQSSTERRIAEYANKLSIFPRLGGAIERNASELAYYNAIRPYWDAIWKEGKGFDRMGKEYKTLAGYLDSLQPGTSKKIEQMIARSKSRAEIEKAIFNGFKTNGLKDALTPEDMEILHAVPGLVDDIDRALTEAQTPEDVRRVFNDSRVKVIKQIRNETRKQARAKAEKLLTRMQVEGVAGGAAAFDEVIDARASALMQHFDRMQAVADDIQARGLMGKERGAVWQAARAEEDQIFRAFEDDEAAKWLGMYQALGSTDVEANALLALLGEGSGDVMGLHSIWRKFFTDSGEEYANYYALPKEAQTPEAWDALQQRNNAEYIQSLLEEDRVMERIDELTARLYGRGKKDATYAYRDMLNWRLSQRDVRRKMAATMAYYRSGKVPAGMEDWVDPAIIDRVRGFTRGMALHKIPFDERAVQNEWFYKEVYRPLVAEQAQVGHATQPKAPKPPATPAQPAKPPPTQPPSAGPTPRQPRPTQPRAVETPTQEVQRVDQTALWRRIAETKPEFNAVQPEGQFDNTAKLRAIKFVKKNGFGKVRTFNEITPEIWGQAVKNEQVRAELQPAITEAPEVTALRQEVDRRTAENTDLRRQIDELRQENRTDERGSGALNYRAFEQDLLIRQARNQDTTIGFFDIRGLGKTNKVFGDAVGDAYLKQLVSIVKKMGMEVYRKGGDEFLVLGDNDAAIRPIMDEVQAQFERAIIETGGRKYAGARFHYGTGSTVAEADAGSLAALNADPRAAEFTSKQYSLTDITDQGISPAEGLDAGNESAVGSAGIETSDLQRQSIERAASAAGQEASLKLASDNPEWDEESYRAFLDMGDAVLIHDETGEVFTADMVTADDIAQAAIESSGLSLTPREYIFTASPRDELPPRISEAIAREAEKMLGEIGTGFAPVRYETDEFGKINRRYRDYANAPEWFPKTKEKTNRVQRMRAALKRIVDGTEAQANDNIGAEISKMKQIIMETFKQGGEYNTLFYLGEYQNLWDHLGEQITRMMDDPNTTADTWREVFGDNAGDMIGLYDLYNRVDDAATDPLPQVDPSALDDTALRLADNIDEAEAQINIEEQFTRTKDDFERAVMEAMPDDGDLVIDLVDSLARNFNPEIDSEDFYNRMGWKFGGEYAGEEGLPRTAPDTPEFRGWFGDSKVVDENGEPLRVYHGSAADFEIFDPSRAGTVQKSDWGKGIYLTPSKYTGDYYRTEAVKKLDQEYNAAYARWEELTKNVKTVNGTPQYSPESLDALREFQSIGRELDRTTKGKTYELYVKIERPYIHKYGGMVDPFLAEHARSNGYDGLIIMTPGGAIDEIVAFSPEQIKSVNNRGTFDPNNPNILMRSLPDRPVDGLTTFTEQGRALMRVYKATDPTAAAHELIHGITPLMRQADADLLRTDLLADMPDLPEDWHTQMGYVGTADQLSPIHVEAYERLSNAFARYLADGRAPTTGLQGLFSRMKNWMLAVYKRIAGGELDIELSSETRAMFDRWIAGDGSAPYRNARPTKGTPYAESMENVEQIIASLDETERTMLAYKNGIEDLSSALENNEIKPKNIKDAQEELDNLRLIYSSTWEEIENTWDENTVKILRSRVEPEPPRPAEPAPVAPTRQPTILSRAERASIRDIIENGAWELPLQKYIDYEFTKLPKDARTAVLNSDPGFVSWPRLEQQIRDNHRREVEYALANNKTVPDEVLADYPELTRTSAVETPASIAPEARAADNLDVPAQSLWDAPAQAGLFQQGEDLPLFSGTAMRAQAETFAPRPEGQQPALIDMREQLPTIGARQAKRQPWEMTQEEFKATQAPDANRYNAVKLAAEAGKPVPPEILAEFPDIKPRPRTEGLLFRTSPRIEGETPEGWARNEARALQAGEAMQAPPLDTRDLPVGTVDQLSSPPHEEAALEILRNRIMPMLDKAESTLAGEAGRGNKLFDFDTLDPEMRKQLRAYLGKVGGQMGDAKLQALRYGKAKRDFALLPYERRYNADTYLQGIMPYEFWYTRSMMNWAIRALNKPQIIGNYLRLQQFFNKQQGRDGMPTRLRKKSFIRLPFLPEWMGEGVYIDPYKQAFPFLQLTGPFERMYNQETQAARRAETLLQQQVEDGTLDAAEAQQAIQTKSGLTWQEAMAQAKNDIDADIQNPVDFARMISGFSLPANILYLYATGRQDEISQLPSTRLVQNLTAGLGIGGPRGVNLESGIRNLAGLPEVDRFEDYRVDRMLAGMAADGDISAEDAQRAMIDRAGPAFEMAQRKVSAMGAFQYFGAPLALDFFPEGEQELRALRDVYNTAYQKYKNGDKQALSKFFDKHPEYQARMASFQEPEERMKRFLISEVWERYNALPAVYKTQAREQLGSTFTDAFLSKETRSYDSIKPETLATWARAIGTDNLPNRTPDTPQIGLKFAPPETAAAVEQYNAEADAKFPGIGQFLASFYQMPQEMQDAARKQYPQIAAYYSWKNKYLATHPDVIPWVTGEQSELYGMPQDIQAGVYQYRAQKDDLFPGIDNIQTGYFSAPDQKAYAKQYPQLYEYWDWRRAMAAQQPKLAPYILSDQALSKAILEPNPTDMLSQEELAMFSETTIQHLYAFYYAREPLRPGPLGELDDIWNELGQPYGTLKKWLNGPVRTSLTGQS